MQTPYERPRTSPAAIAAVFLATFTLALVVMVSRLEYRRDECLRAQARERVVLPGCEPTVSPLR